MIRDFETNDIFDIEDIWLLYCSDDFAMPNYNSHANVLKKTIEFEGKVVGSAFVHLTAEIGLIIDKSLPNITRAKLIRDVFIDLVSEMEKTDLEDYHIFVVPDSDERYAKFLINNFGFEKDKGIGLCRRLENEQSKRECSTVVSKQLNDVSSYKNSTSS